MPDLHPALAKALERDGITVSELARLVGVDARTINRWDESYRDLCDFVKGRARAVQVQGGPIGEPALQSWMLERLGDDGVSKADVVKAIADIAEARARIDNAAQRLRGHQKHIDSPKKEFKGPSLTMPPIVYTVGPMNPALMNSVATQIRKRSRGRMVMFAMKVPPDFTARLASEASKAGLNSSDYLRALVELHTRPPESGQE